MPKVLLTGGAGYIGAHCTHHLIKHGHSVVVVDNLSEGKQDFIPDEATFIEGDIRDRVTLTKAFENDIDAVMHFAAYSKASASIQKPISYYQNNVNGSLQLIETMLRNKVDKIIFSSTAAVYGEPEKVPIKENMQTNPINPYGRSKLMTEKILSDTASSTSLSFVNLRYFNAAGAGYGIGEAHEPETHLIPIILQAASGERDKISIYGTDYDTKDGTCVRDFIHVLDIAEAHRLALEHLMTDGECKTYNLGSEVGYSVRQVINTCKQVTNKDFKVEEASKRQGDPAVLVASAKKIRKEVGWKCQHHLEEIIESAWEWHLGQNND